VRTARRALLRVRDRRFARGGAVVIKRRPLFVGRSPATFYFPRDRFFCFFTFKLSIGSFAPVPRETGLGTRCFFDFPATPILLDRGRVATDNPTLQAVGGCAVLCAGRTSRQTLASPERGGGLLDWHCGQNPGRIPEGRQRASWRRKRTSSISHELIR
jgi:hypothetical protein